MALSSEWTSWADGMGLAEETVEQLTFVSEEARRQGFDGHLPPGDVGAWGLELEAAGLDDLAMRARAAIAGRLWNGREVDEIRTSRGGWRYAVSRGTYADHEVMVYETAQTAPRPRAVDLAEELGLRHVRPNEIDALADRVVALIDGAPCVGGA